jgi:zinc transporter ZupT
MDFQQISSFVAPIGLVIAGVYIKTSNKEEIYKFKKYWLFFVIGGAFMFSYRLFKYLN